jgi:hypothetical protein
MKKILFVFIALSVMQMIATAQVDMSLFKKDQIWLFADKKYGSQFCDGIILTKDSLIYEYEDSKYPAKSLHAKIPDYLQPKAVYNYQTLFFHRYKIDEKKQLFYFTRSGYAWKIIKLTDNDLIIERFGKCFDDRFADWDNYYPKRFHFKREQKIKSACLPVLENGDGNFSTDMVSQKIVTYIKVLSFNKKDCPNFYPSYYPEKEKK